jgi:ADP-heptose:LPS heptosyltransferase
MNPPRSVKTPETCLVNISGIGDIVSSLVVAQTLIQRNHRITYVIPEKFKGLLAGSDYHEAYPNRFGREMPPFDLLIDLTSNRDSREICRKIRSTHRMGRYKNLRQRILRHSHYSRMVKKFTYDHIVRDYYPLSEALGYVCDRTPCLKPMSTVRRSDGSKHLSIHIGANNEKRRIQPDLILEIILYAKASGVRVRLIGSEEEIAGRIRQMSGGYPEYQSAELPTVRQWLEESDLVIAPDSGILHLAGALGKPCIALYGPNLFSRSGPLSTNVAAIELDYDCRPCIQKRPCPYDTRCMRNIRFEQVMEKLKLFLYASA